MRIRRRLLMGLAGLTLISTGVAVAGAADAAVLPGPAVSWGFNGHGQLGDGTTTTRLAPVKVCAVGQTAPCSGQLTQVVQLAAGDDDTSAALLVDGTVLAWGDGSVGSVGNGTTTSPVTTPTRVCAVGQTAPCSAFLTGVTAIAAGRSHLMALRSDGTVVAWGNN